MIGGGLIALLLASATPGLSGGGEGAPLRVRLRSGGATPSMASAAGIGAKWGVVTSVHRSPERNRAVGGAPNSWHLQGRAIDIARRPGVRHAEIDAAYRRAGYVLIESLDEGDHSHFAFGLPGQAPRPAASAKVQLASAGPDPTPICKAEPENALTRRRPDRSDGCPDPSEPAPRLRPIQAE